MKPVRRLLQQNQKGAKAQGRNNMPILYALPFRKKEKLEPRQKKNNRWEIFPQIFPQKTTNKHNRWEIFPQIFPKKKQRPKN